MEQRCHHGEVVAYNGQAFIHRSTGRVCERGGSAGYGVRPRAAREEGVVMELDEALDRLRRIADLPVDAYGPSRDVAASRLVLARLDQLAAAAERVRKLCTDVQAGYTGTASAIDMAGLVLRTLDEPATAESAVLDAYGPEPQ